MLRSFYRRPRRSAVFHEPHPDIAAYGGARAAGHTRRQRVQNHVVNFGRKQATGYWPIRDVVSEATNLRGVAAGYLIDHEVIFVSNRKLGIANGTAAYSERYADLASISTETSHGISIVAIPNIILAKRIVVVATRCERFQAQITAGSTASRIRSGIQRE